MQSFHKDRQIRDPGTPFEPDLESADPLREPLAHADQACKECRRRKAKCTREIPTCEPCSNYGRHCLYEKHSKTPLTRKHLTEVEERLERAERLLRQARLKSLRTSNTQHPPPEVNRQSPSTTRSPELSSARPTSSLKIQQPEFDFNAISHISQHSNTYDPFIGNSHLEKSSNPGLPNDFYSPNDELTRYNLGSQHPYTSVDDESHLFNNIDSPPSAVDNFEWNEQDLSAREISELGEPPLDFNSSDGDRAETVVDGMASLTVSESDGGYLGVASGASFLRIIDPSTTDLFTQQSNSSKTRLARISSVKPRPVLLHDQPNPNRHIVDSMIDAYFRIYNVSYPVVHEPTFRAQYSEVIDRPNGDCWTVLAYVVAAIGVFTSAPGTESADLQLFAHAKSLMQGSFLESGNMTLVQALTLISNYLQKRNKPNSGYNYLGLAQRMAMGIGLHKEFQGWHIQPLKMEIRRRVWWCLAVFDLGATITFGRPIVWPGGGIDVALPLNVHDRDLTAASQHYPNTSLEITTYTALRSYSSFYLATNKIYSRVISKPFPSAKELIALDDQLLGGWYSSLPFYFAEDALVPPKYRTSQAIMMWKYRNFKIIMYRPFVIRQALCARQGYLDKSAEGFQAYNRCLEEARLTIQSIENFWNSEEHTTLGAWYALYFLFQASLIPCICLRNKPDSENAGDWRKQIAKTLQLIESISETNPSGSRCHEVISSLCEQYLPRDASPSAPPYPTIGPIDESPQTQLNNVYSMMWPSIPASEADVAMQGDVWMDFLSGEDTFYDEAM